MHHALHFNLKFLAEEVVEGGEHLQVPHAAWLDSWDVNVQAQQRQFSVDVAGLFLHCDERNTTWPRVLEIIDLYDGGEDTGLAVAVHQSNHELPIKLSIGMLEVSLLFHPES